MFASVVRSSVVRSSADCMMLRGMVKLNFLQALPSLPVVCLGPFLWPLQQAGVSHDHQFCLKGSDKILASPIPCFASLARFCGFFFVSTAGYDGKWV